ncbi:MAG TPA: hydrogen gas-evolving membrane-bound hydrogenase subunit E [Atribacteraceae bacterium]|nr:hydrogen gas-evolving membrane-bound hydrogenase subunit E [Atribacteraceae bacterium]
MTRFRHLVTLIVLLGIGFILTMAVIDMPVFGDPEAPAHRHIAPRYIARAYEETGVPNMVTAIILDYRGYDTLGELTVIFAGGAAVLSLLVGRKH